MSEFVYRVDTPNVDNESCLLYETIFHNANGYLGVRSCLEEGYPENYDSIRGTYLNGFYDITTMNQAEKLYGLIEEKQTMLNVNDVQGIKLWVDGEEFHMWRGEVMDYSRKIALQSGYTERKLIWISPKGHKIQIQIRRMASLSRLNLFFIDYQVTPLNFSGELCLRSDHRGDVKNYCNPEDPRVAGEVEQYLHVQSIEQITDGSLIVSRTSKSNLELCSAVMHKGTIAKRKRVEQQSDSIAETFWFDGEASQTVQLIKFCAFADSIRFTDIQTKVKKVLSDAAEVGVEFLYREQKEYLERFWTCSSLEIDGDEELNQAIHFNMYQLLQSAGKDGFSNITAKGLSGEGYEGHYFWDTEMYMQPFFVLTNPEVSKKLIEFRYRTLDKARENARLLGHAKGAAYPWRTIMGKECSGYYPSGSAAYHISADVAYSVITYYLATKDLLFIEKVGAEIVFETARLWVDMGYEKDGVVHINEVTGPNEYTCLVNDNYFTNVSAKYNLYWAYKLYQLLKSAGKLDTLSEKIGISEAEAEEFLEISKKIYLPYNAELDINPQDDSFLNKKKWDIEKTPENHFPLLLHYHPMYLYRHQVCKQADTVLAHILFEEEEKLSTIQHSFEYYEKITTHDSSLSTCMFSIMASRLGFLEKAYRYFGDSAQLDLHNTHGNTKDGLHTANMGGNYMAIVYGFAGLRIKEGGISFAPVLPKEWNGYRFRIVYENRIIEISVNSKECSFTLVKGEKIDITVYGKIYTLDAQLCISREANRYKAVIFDLDGVVTDSAKYHYLAWKQISEELGIEFDEAFNEKLKGISRIRSLELILQRDKKSKIYTQTEKQKIAQQKNQYYQKLIDQMTEKDILPGISLFIQELKEHGYKIALASASENAEKILHQLGLTDSFDYIADVKTILKSKPEPDIFLACAEQLGVEPLACIGIEDAESGIEAIHRADMKAIGVGNPEQMRKADLIVRTSELKLDLIYNL